MLGSRLPSTEERLYAIVKTWPWQDYVWKATVDEFVLGTLVRLST